MKPPTKDQTDIGVDNPTKDASHGAIFSIGEDVKENEDMARHELRDEWAREADINNMLNKFGVAPAIGQPKFGEWDDTIDLQQAITSSREARAAFERVPKELQEKFPTLNHLLEAVESGDLVIKNEELPEEKPPA